MTLVRRQATFASGASTAARLAILAGWCELGYRMAVRLGDEVRHCGVLARLVAGSRGPGDADVSLEDRPVLSRETWLLPDCQLDSRREGGGCRRRGRRGGPARVARAVA